MILSFYALNLEVCAQFKCPNVFYYNSSVHISQCLICLIWSDCSILTVVAYEMSIVDFSKYYILERYLCLLIWPKNSWCFLRQLSLCCSLIVAWWSSPQARRHYISKQDYYYYYSWLFFFLNGTFMVRDKNTFSHRHHYYPFLLLFAGWNSGRGTGMPWDRAKVSNPEWDSQHVVEWGWSQLNWTFVTNQL